MSRAQSTRPLEKLRPRRKVQKRGSRKRRDGSRQGAPNKSTQRRSLAPPESPQRGRQGRGGGRGEPATRTAPQTEAGRRAGGAAEKSRRGRHPRTAQRGSGRTTTPPERMTARNQPPPARTYDHRAERRRGGGEGPRHCTAPKPRGEEARHSDNRAEPRPRQTSAGESK